MSRAWSIVALAALGILLTGATVWAAEPDEAKTWDFQSTNVDELPSGWSAGKTGTGPGSVWKIVEDDTAPQGAKVLAQTSSEGPKPLYNLCLADDSLYADLDLSVQLNAVRGKIDQGGGPLWRFKDANNYYVVRVNPLESNFRLYKVIAGRRTQLATADSEAAQKQWHTIRVVHQGDRIQCYLNGELLLEAKDDTLHEPGKVGLWTKADAVTSFDNLRVAAPAK